MALKGVSKPSCRTAHARAAATVLGWSQRGYGSRIFCSLNLQVTDWMALVTDVAGIAFDSTRECWLWFVNWHPLLMMCLNCLSPLCFATARSFAHATETRFING